MAKLFYKKIEQCRDCPQFFGGQSPHCVFNNEQVDPNTIPGHCHLVDYQEKIEIILDRETKDLLNCGEKKQIKIDELEKQAKTDLKLQNEENELRRSEALKQFETISNEFSKELSLLLKKYNVDLYYNNYDEV